MKDANYCELHLNKIENQSAERSDDDFYSKGQKFQYMYLQITDLYVLVYLENYLSWTFEIIFKSPANFSCITCIGSRLSDQA